MSITPIENLGNVTPVQSTKINNDYNKINLEIPNDSFEFSKTEPKELTKEKKQEIAQKAQTTAAGWAIFGGLISTAYFGLRSDKAVAKKYNLDAEQDNTFIRELKKKQVLWTLPAMIHGVGLITGTVAWLYNKNQNPAKINVD